MIMTTLKQCLNARMNTNNRIMLIVLTLLCFDPIQSAANAGSNLIVTPTRVVFKERDYTEQVTIMNTGTETGNFRISCILQDMTETGKFELVEANEIGAGCAVTAGDDSNPGG